MASESPKPFSKRHGYAKPKEISIWEDAPDNLRIFVVTYAHSAGYAPDTLREIVCSVLGVKPDLTNYSDYPNIWYETQQHVYDCEWYKVYDFSEQIYKLLSKPTPNERGFSSGSLPDLVQTAREIFHHVERSLRPAKFQSDLNEFFIDEGIGWQMLNGVVVTRGTETFESSFHGAVASLEQAGRVTARNEMHEALADLSRRPEADLTGAIQHAMAALECVARDVCGGETLTLGRLLKKYPGTIPKPLDDAVVGAWGYASEMARHIREGRNPERRDVELVVSLAATVATYLSRER